MGLRNRKLRDANLWNWLLNIKTINLSFEMKKWNKKNLDHCSGQL